MPAKPEQEGFGTWLDTDRIGGGAVWRAQIENEIDRRQVMIALLSPSSHTSERSHRCGNWPLALALEAGNAENPAGDCIRRRPGVCYRWRRSV